MLKFQDMKVRTRLWVLSLISVLGVLSMGAVIGYSQWEDLNDAKKRELEALVESKMTVVKMLKEKADKGEITEEAAKASVKDFLRAARYAENDYFWISDLNNVYIMHPMRPELEGKDSGDMKDPSGKFVMRSIVDAAKYCYAISLDFSVYSETVGLRTNRSRQGFGRNSRRGFDSFFRQNRRVDDLGCPSSKQSKNYH